MFSAKPTFIPRFAINDVTDGGGRVNVTEPPTDKKNNGWEYLEKPARDYMNWIHRGNYLWIDYFNQFWNSSHQFVINEIESEGGAGISILDTLKVDVITELTGSAGVTIEGITLLDGYINEPVGIKVAPVSGTNLHVNQADSAASVQLFTNSTTGTTATDGFEIGIDASEQGRIWNYENTDLVIGTNNTEMLLIDNAGNIGVRNGIPLYIYSAGNDKYLSLIHNDTNALISTNSGNIYTDKSFGIGVIPSNPLHVQSTTTPQVRIAYDGSNYFMLNATAEGNMFITPTGLVVGIDAGKYLNIYSDSYTGALTLKHTTTNAEIYTNTGNIVITNTTECTGADTGALQVDGGVHVAKNAYFGQLINVATTITAGTGITATTGEIIATAGYFKSGKGRWPTGYFEYTFPTQAEIFSALNSVIPNANDEIIITGSWMEYNVVESAAWVRVFHRAKRYDTNNIDLYYQGIKMDGSFYERTYIRCNSTGGVIPTIISIAW